MSMVNQGTKKRKKKMSGKQLKSPNSERLEVINPVRPHEGSIIVPTSQMKNQRL